MMGMKNTKLALVLLVLSFVPLQAFLSGPIATSCLRCLHQRSAQRSSQAAGRVSAPITSCLSNEHAGTGQNKITWGGDAVSGLAVSKFGLPAVAFNCMLALFISAEPVQAEGRTGQQVFSQKCAACHANGGNVLNGAKTLKSDALAKYGYNNIDKVTEIITKGKAPMPAYGIKSKKLGLDPDEIQAVAQFVLDRADEDWQKPRAPAAASAEE